MTDYTLVAETDSYTVVGSYTPVESDRNPLLYESEAALEKRFISILCEQGYTYLPIRTEGELVANLRAQLERLNRMTFTDREWEGFFATHFANERLSVQDKAETIQEDFVKVLRREDGTTKNVKLLDKAQIHNNSLQVINQYETSSCSSSSSGSRDSSDPTAPLHKNRYDVTILVNGIPLVHCELKRRGVAIREAFNQINRYIRESFWSGTGLFGFVQVFVISNGTHTKYYSNTTRYQHIREHILRARTGNPAPLRKRTSNSFEFTSWWADGENRPIEDLYGFARTFMSKHTLLAILTRYCVWTEERLLMVMRPYQIAATERILQRIVTAVNQKWEGSVKGGGYIWHTTGSGKTLTSFKTATLAARMDGVDKVLFVVDRSDLDYQTIREYDKFQKGAANSNANTAILERQLTDPAAKIIITTIQKLGLLCGRGLPKGAESRRTVIIFDECHRSQFGELHQKIVKSFKRYHIFGFTGTPIFAANAGSGNPFFRTTPQAFGEQLHAYTIVDAIRDGNVLPFHIETVNTVKMKEMVKDSEVTAIDTDEVLLHKDRIAAVVRYILTHFDDKTIRNKSYNLKGQRVLGFNSMMAVQSIPMARAYYEEFRRQMAEPGAKQLKVATIFTYCANEDDPEDGALDAGGDPSQLSSSDREFLESAIADYNSWFDTNFSTNGDQFANYYRNLSEKIKTRQVDLTIVVNMFLTGFDATTLNTLWVDKRLRMHGLIQAFSRTNRILNSVKSFGNIICFRDLQQETDAALSLFGDKDARGLVLVRTFTEYMNGYTDGKGREVKGWLQLIAELKERFPLGEPIVGEENERDFIKLYGQVLRLKNILSAFDQFAGHEQIGEGELQDYQSVYLDLHDKWKPVVQSQKASILDGVEFEMELVRQVDVNIDYILMLVQRYHDENALNKEIKAAIDKAIGSSVQLRSKKELIQRFVESLNAQTGDVAEEWVRYVAQEQERELSALIAEENLRETETRGYFGQALADGVLRGSGTDLDLILPPMSRFGASAQNREEKKRRVFERLNVLFERYRGLPR